MSGTAGQQIGTSGTIPPIGAYVQDATHPNGITNFIGCNPEIAYKTDQGIALAFTCPTNEEAATGGVGVWVKSASTLIPTDKVAIVDGVATKDNTTGTHTVFTNAVANDYLWVLDVA